MNEINDFHSREKMYKIKEDEQLLFSSQWNEIIQNLAIPRYT